MRLPPALDAPASPVPRRLLWEEVAVVLSLSLLPSAIRAVISLLRAPIAGVVVASANRSASFIDQLLPFVFGLAPVFLVVHLLRRSGEGVAAIGLGWDRPRRDAAYGAVLFAIVGLAGIGIYLGAVELGVNRFVVPAPPEGYWWTWLAVVMNALEAALVEEVIVLGYLVTRLQQLGGSATAAIAGSALLRGSYHLYQGWGGFVGNLLMGVLFAWLFTRTRRTWPFVAAHLFIDVAAAAGFLLFRDLLPGF
ncbi:MAG TPA: type II CAAX endopeptidase family protein [Actinomycetota bacterium]